MYTHLGDPTGVVKNLSFMPWDPEQEIYIASFWFLWMFKKSIMGFQKTWINSSKLKAEMTILSDDLILKAQLDSYKKG